MHAQPLLQLFLFLSATSSAAPLNANNLAKRDDLVPANEAGLANLPGAENLSAIKTLPIAGGLVQRRQLQGAENDAVYGTAESQPEDDEEEEESDDEEDGYSDAGSESDSEAGDDDDEEEPSSTSTDGPVNPPFALPPTLETPAAAVGGGGVESAAEGVAGGATDAVQPQPSGGSLLSVAANVNL
ncbi:hypothetical protein SLS58_008480 [Diplodia intermedia]|uniref:Uncharacterized protein n=1 Tax=Diplodia intermedia TaxID=856260 RepID=A0ABR3THB5_9PEZI